MSHVFRPKSSDRTLNILTEEGTSWFPSKKYNKEIAAEFIDPAFSLKAFFNSLPTPFARIEVFRQGLEFVTGGGDSRNQGRHEEVLDKDNRKMHTFHHYLVSHCLDVLELLFNFNSIKGGDYQGKNKFTIVKWPLKAGIDRLEESSREGRALLGKTLSLYKKTHQRLNSYLSGASGDELSSIDNLYFILRDGEAIAATSPLTLAFTTPNIIQPFQISGSHYQLFAQPESGQPPVPLHKRSPEFQLYLHALRSPKVNPLFDKNFPEFNEYLRQSGRFYADPMLQDQIKQVDSLTLEEFQSKYDLVDAAGNIPTEISGVYFGQISEKRILDGIEQESDFVLDTRSDFKQIYGQNTYTPLALRDNFTYSWKYTSASSKWSHDYKITEVHLASPIEQRSLPGISYNYPFLTAEDLLEDKLIRVRYPINEENYLTVKPSGLTSDKNAYMLPLKPLFFKYFKKEDILNFLEISHLAGETTAKLTLPLRGGKTMTFEQKYSKEDVVTADFALSIFPSYKTGKKEYDNFYRLMLTYFDVDVTPTFYHFYDSAFNKQIENTYFSVQGSVRAYERTLPSRLQAGSTFYAVDDTDFDFISLNIKLEDQQATGLLIPKWVTPRFENSKEYTFALDFGTTNTHIAFKENEGFGQHFFVDHSEKMLLSLRKHKQPETNESYYQVFTKIMEPAGSSGADQLLQHEFLPPIISPKDVKNGQYAKFPTRTILALAGDLDTKTDESGKPAILFNSNIDLLYNKSNSPKSIKHIPNLKWLFANAKQKNYTYLFIKELLLLVRAKVILNNAWPHNTKITWFYPLSMSIGQQQALGQNWNGLYQNLFATENKTYRINESEAPYHWQLKNNAFFESTKVLSIDIGGGTSDVVFIEDEKIIWGTSFMFGANSLFGNGSLGQKGIKNGMVKHFEQIFREDKNSEDYMQIYKSLKANAELASDELNNFFFSVPEFDYPNRLAGPENHFKFSILVHFSAIIYHTARIAYHKFLEAYKTHPLLKKPLDGLTEEEVEKLDKLKMQFIPQFICFSGNGSGIIKILNNGTNVEKGDSITKLTTNIFSNVFDIQRLTLRNIEFSIPPKGSKEVTCLGGLIKSTASDYHFKPTISFGMSDLTEQKEVTYKELLEQEDYFDEVVAEVKRFIGILKGYKNTFDDEFQIRVRNEYFDCFTDDYQMRGYLVRGVKYRLQDLKINEDKLIDHSLFFYPITGGTFNVNNIIFNDL